MIELLAILFRISDRGLRIGKAESAIRNPHSAIL
jgi:hypothetical protein